MLPNIGKVRARLLLPFDSLRRLNSIILIFLSTFAFLALSWALLRLLRRLMHHKFNIFWVWGPLRARWLFGVALWRWFFRPVRRGRRLWLFQDMFAGLFGRVVACFFEVGLTDLFEVVALAWLFGDLRNTRLIVLDWLFWEVSWFFSIFASDSTWLHFAPLMTSLSSMNCSRWLLISLSSVRKARLIW